MSRRMKGSKTRGRSKKNKRKDTLTKEDRQLMRTVMVILSLFTITIVPVFAAIMVAMYTETTLCYSREQVWLLFLSTYTLICGRFLNVVIYNVLNKEFHEARKKFFTLVLDRILRRKSKVMEGLPKRTLSSRKSWSFYGNSTKRRKNSSSSKSYSKDTESSAASFRSKLSLKLSLSNNSKKNNNNNEFQEKINTVCVCNNKRER